MVREFTIGNPLKAIPRYANLALSGIQGKVVPEFAAAVQPGMVDSAIYNSTSWAHDNPMAATASVMGGLVANQLLGNPLGRVIDTVDFGLTNFSGDNDDDFSYDRPPQVVIMQQPGMSNPQMGTPMQQPGMVVSLPGLNEEERRNQVKYINKRMATDALTVQALQQQPGMGGSNGYY